MQETFASEDSAWFAEALDKAEALGEVPDVNAVNDTVSMSLMLPCRQCF